MYKTLRGRGLAVLLPVMLLAVFALFTSQPQPALAQVATATPVPPSSTPVPAPSNTPAPPAATTTPAATVAPSPTQSHSGRVFISCIYYGPYDREFDLILEQGHGGAPTVNVTIDLVSGGQQNDQFTAYSKSYRGPYLTLSANATWPDQATGYASATCGYAIPTDTPLPTDTPNYNLTPTPTDTATPTRIPRDNFSPTPIGAASPTTPAGQVTPPATTPSPAPGTLTPGATPPLSQPSPTLPPSAPTASPKPKPLASPTAAVSSQTGYAGGPIPGLPNTGQPDNFTTWLIILMLISASLGYWLRRRSKQLNS